MLAEEQIRMRRLWSVTVLRLFPPAFGEVDRSRSPSAWQIEKM